MKNPKPYMNPFIAGFSLGILLLMTFYITGRGLGASGAIKSGVVYAVNTVAPSHSESSKFYKEYNEEHKEGPLKNWLVFEIVGVIIGAFVSGVWAKRANFKIEKGPNISNKLRLIMALIGGLLFGLGAQFGRGCTSGAALTGMAAMSFGGIITMFAIFGSAYLFAYFFRKLWI
jgi:uncharacterized protein